MRSSCRRSVRKSIWVIRGTPPFRNFSAVHIASINSCDMSQAGPFRTTVVGSYPRPQQPGDTIKKPALSRQEADDVIRWAARDQADAGLDIVSDGEGRRENM